MKAKVKLSLWPKKNRKDIAGLYTAPKIWCSECCQWIESDGVHTCYDYIKTLVERIVPSRYPKRRQELYQEIVAIALRKNVYNDF